LNWKDINPLFSTQIAIIVEAAHPNGSKHHQQGQQSGAPVGAIAAFVGCVITFNTTARLSSAAAQYASAPSSPRPWRCGPPSRASVNRPPRRRSPLPEARRRDIKISQQTPLMLKSTSPSHRHSTTNGCPGKTARCLAARQLFAVCTKPALFFPHFLPHTSTELQHKKTDFQPSQQAEFGF